MPRTTRSRRPLIVHSVWLQAKYETEEVLVWYRGRRRRWLWALILNTMRLGEGKVIVCLVGLEKMRVLFLFRGSYGILFILELGHSTLSEYSMVVVVKYILLVQCLLFEFTLSGRSYMKQKPISPLLLPLQRWKRIYWRFKWNLLVRIGQPSKFKLKRFIFNGVIISNF